MSKRQFKSQASSSRAVFGNGAGFGGFGSGATRSTLSYLTEPPNLSSISDPNVVVAFKNLLKKDSTTKAKGLEDLRLHVLSSPNEQGGGVEQSILEAWVKLYPRISIDNSRRVRELSHTLQYELLKSARKSMEKFIPSIVGAWLAGIYDRDRPVSKAATDGLNSFFDSEEKILLFWRRCQVQILEFAQEAILETPETLSDERTVNADESQAKFDRVVGASLSLGINLLTKLSEKDINKHEEAYKKFITGNRILWGFIASKDSFVRRTTAQLVLICLEKQPGFIEEDLESVGTTFIDAGLRSPQLSSSLAFTHALGKLTATFPTVWTTSYKGKKPPLSRLRRFLEKGSQLGPADYWKALNSLLAHLPSGVLPTDITGATDFLKSLGDGISIRDEPRLNIPTAWICYVNTVRQLQKQLTDPKEQNQLLVATVYPLFEHFIRPTPEGTRWATGNSTAALAKAFHLCAASEARQSDAPLSQEWNRLAETVITGIQTSLPEQSKDFEKSQTSVASEAHRWFKLQAEICKYSGADRADAELYKHILTDASASIISRSLEVLSARNGKPFGAAGAVEGALRLAPDVVLGSASSEEAITSFLKTELSKLVTSPSAPYLIASLKLLCTFPGQEAVCLAIWESTIRGLINVPTSKQQAVAAEALISFVFISEAAQKNNDVQEFLFSSTSRYLQNGESEWRRVFEAAIKFNCFNNGKEAQVLDTITGSLDTETPGFLNAVDALEYVVAHRPQLLEERGTRHITVMTKLLELGESGHPGVVSKVGTLRSAIGNIGTSGGLPHEKGSPIVSIIQENLESVGPRSLSIDTLVAQAEGIATSNGTASVSDLFPDKDNWHEALRPILLACGKDLSLSLTNILGGTIALASPEDKSSSSTPIERDLDGYSAALRMAIYSSKLFAQEKILKSVPIDDQIDIIYLLCLTVEVANDQLGLRRDDLLWLSLDEPDIESDIQDFIATSQRALAKILNGSNNWLDGEQSDMGHALVSRLFEESKGNSTTAFYAGRVLANVLSSLVESHGWHTASGEEWLTSRDALKSSTPNGFTAVAILAGLKESLGSSKTINNLCNRLVSDVTSLSLTSEKAPLLLGLMNAALAVYDQDSLPVANNRLVFAVKQITGWLEQPEILHPVLAAQASRSLQLLLPGISEVYGPYWQTSIDFCVAFWNSKPVMRDANRFLSAIHASLRLVILLRGLEEPNDDLVEALEDAEHEISEGMVTLLALNRPEIETQPWRIVNELIYRQVTKVPLKHIKDLSDLYPLVASDFPVIQSAAFGILHRALPAAQGDISVNVLLEKKDAQLPEELCSLLLDSPQMENFPDDILSQFPPPIRTYLLSWHLIFDAFSTASHKVRNDYTTQLKTENLIAPLLNLLFDILGHSAGKPLNLDRARLKSDAIRVYDMDVASAEPDEYNMQWLLVHLYYLCLKFTPGLVKSWYLECKSKQTRLAVESWTEKSFSPLVIVDTLDDVEIWAAGLEAPPDDEKELIVKVSKKSREVYAGYEVDEMTMQIAIRFPPIYPLESIKVDGVNRVAVSEKQWQSWLMIIQGVITFSNGSITDGLLAFRRNVTGALKGQTECAICYSIVSSDKKMPDKRCQTCKHLFHSSCLFKWFASSNQIGAWIITFWSTRSTHHSFLKLQIFHNIAKMSEEGSNTIRDFRFNVSAPGHRQFLRMAFAIGMLPKDPEPDLSSYTLDRRYNHHVDIVTFLDGESIQAVSLVAENPTHQKFVWYGLHIGFLPSTFLEYVPDSLDLVCEDFSSEDINSVTLLMQGVEQALRVAFDLPPAEIVPSTQVDVPRKKNFSQLMGEETVTIIVAEGESAKKFVIHKDFLMNKVAFFEKMFNSKFLESSTGRKYAARTVAWALVNSEASGVSSNAIQEALQDGDLLFDAITEIRGGNGHNHGRAHTFPICDYHNHAKTNKCPYEGGQEQTAKQRNQKRTQQRNYY
ncbi:hypothetical protein V496_06791 [Pseudogymnoascus sp. VKM F-4515 (FW-2607)]|nr:hypothetical protein V496_06791 [Pseudogymnoascus sp. VKM F-4515 (FW-2607)]